jgi:hypothetical protein
MLVSKVDFSYVCPFVFLSAVQNITRMYKYKTIIFLVVLYECETFSLTLREEHRVRVFEKRVRRRIFGLKRDEVSGGWRKLHHRSSITCTLRQI